MWCPDLPVIPPGHHSFESTHPSRKQNPNILNFPLRPSQNRKQTKRKHEKKLYHAMETHNPTENEQNESVPDLHHHQPESASSVPTGTSQHSPQSPGCPSPPRIFHFSTHLHQSGP
jgi:hypothetical protein